MSFITRKNLPIIAIAILLVGMGSTLYVHATKQTKNSETPTLLINDQEYYVDELFSLFSLKTVTTDDSEYTGIPLDELLVYAHIDNPTSHQYTIKANGYQQTVQWESMETGIFYRDELRVVFPNLAHSFWVYDVLEIEVM